MSASITEILTDLIPILDAIEEPHRSKIMKAALCSTSTFEGRITYAFWYGYRLSQDSTGKRALWQGDNILWSEQE